MGLVKLVAIFLLCTSVVVRATSENYFPHFLFKRATKTTTCTSAGISCINDCKDVRICTPLGDTYKENVIKCEEEDPKKPYCGGESCSSSKSPKCSSTGSSGFECTDSGYFPDPDDCTKYYLCEGVGGTVHEMICEKNYVYQHSSSYCVKKRLSSDCAVIKCKSTALFQYVVYPKDANVYGLCVKGQPTTVFRCPEGQEFNVDSAKCAVACKEEGLIAADKNACSKEYIRCKKISSTKYQAILEECPGATKFDSNSSRCVVGTCESGGGDGDGDGDTGTGGGDTGTGGGDTGTGGGDTGTGGGDTGTGGGDTGTGGGDTGNGGGDTGTGGGDTGNGRR